MTSSLHTLIGHGQGTTKVHQTNRPQNQIETGWKSAWEGEHRSLNVRQKLRNLRNCSRRRRKGHNSREACSSLTLLADARATKKKSLPSQIPEGGLMQRIKERRLKILQHLQKTLRRRSNRSSRCFHTKRPSQVMKHRRSLNFQPYTAEACRNQRPIPHTCGYRQLLRIQLG